MNHIYSIIYNSFKTKLIKNVPYSDAMALDYKNIKYNFDQRIYIGELK